MTGSLFAVDTLRGTDMFWMAATMFRLTVPSGL